MAYHPQILLGRITRIHGHEGAVSVKLEKNFTEDLSGLESVFIEIDGKPVPFFISESDYPGGDILKLKLKWYSSVNQVSEFTGCRLFLTTGKSERIAGDQNASIKGYRVKLQDNSLLGTVKDIIESPGQLLMNIESTRGKIFLVPLHTDLILAIDHKKKTIKMNLPEGLIDIN